MSQIHYEEKELDELVKYARAILVVKNFADAWQPKSIPIQAKGKIYQPFDFVVHNYEVVRVLHNRDIKAGSMIEVYPADFEASLERHRKYYLMGMSTSPLFARYTPSTYQPEDETFLVFLSNTDDGLHWSYYCLGAREGLEYEEIVEQLMKSDNAVFSH